MDIPGLCGKSDGFNDSVLQSHCVFPTRGEVIENPTTLWHRVSPIGNRLSLHHHQTLCLCWVSAVFAQTVQLHTLHMLEKQHQVPCLGHQASDELLLLACSEGFLADFAPLRLGFCSEWEAEESPRERFPVLVQNVTAKDSLERPELVGHLLEEDFVHEAFEVHLPASPVVQIRLVRVQYGQRAARVHAGDLGDVVHGIKTKAEPPHLPNKG